jgi:hypothetical protein
MMSGLQDGQATSQLSGTTAAVKIAIINSFVNIAGFGGLYLIGCIKETIGEALAGIEFLPLFLSWLGFAIRYGSAIVGHHLDFPGRQYYDTDEATNAAPIQVDPFFAESGLSRVIHTWLSAVQVKATDAPRQTRDGRTPIQSYQEILLEDSGLTLEPEE